MCRAIVVTTGMHAEIGKIQASVQAAAEDEEPTPLKNILEEFGDMLSKFFLVICILVWPSTTRTSLIRLMGVP